MKKKSIITAAVIVILVGIIVGGCIFLATRHRSGKLKTKTLGIVNSSYEIAGQNIYFDYNLALSRYNTETDTLERLCHDPKCDGECILENVIYTSKIIGNRFYFSFYSDTSGFAYYDIKTGSTKIIKQYDKNVYNEFFLYNGNIYHMRNIPEEELSDTVYCISVDSGKEEAIINLESGEELLMVADGLIFTKHTVAEGNGEDRICYSTVYAYDIKTLQKCEIWHTDKDKYNAILSRAQFYNGKLYFLIGTYEYNEAEISMINFLCCVDTASGEASCIGNITANSFYLTYEGIYIITEEITSTTATNLSSNPQINVIPKIKILLFDYNGNEVLMTYQNENITSYLGRIANRKFIGEIKYYEEGKKRTRNVIINLESGEIKDIIEP